MKIICILEKDNLPLENYEVPVAAATRCYLAGHSDIRLNEKYEARMGLPPLEVMLGLEDVASYKAAESPFDDNFTGIVVLGKGATIETAIRRMLHSYTMAMAQIEEADKNSPGPGEAMLLLPRGKSVNVPAHWTIKKLNEFLAVNFKNCGLGIVKL